MTPKTQQSLFRVVRTCALHSARFRLSGFDDMVLTDALLEGLGDQLVDFFEDRFPEYLKKAPRKTGSSGSGEGPGSQIRTRRTFPPSL